MDLLFEEMSEYPAELWRTIIRHLHYETRILDGDAGEIFHGFGVHQLHFRLQIGCAGEILPIGGLGGQHATNHEINPALFLVDHVAKIIADRSGAMFAGTEFENAHLSATPPPASDRATPCSSDR